MLHSQIHLRSKARFCLLKAAPKHIGGYSLSELIWIIALMGILASIAIPNIGESLSNSKAVIARQKLEMMNKGVHAFAECAGFSISRTPINSSATDETLVLHDLQTRSLTNPTPGSPFVDPTYRPVSSSDPNDYRIVWTSNFVFKLLSPGETGTGLKVPFDGSDLGDPWVAPPGYNPGGR